MLALVAGIIIGCRKAPSSTIDATRPTGPSFQHDILPVFARHCASAKDCHGDDPAESVKLDLRAPAAFRDLVDAPAELRPGAVRVKPNDPAASFLISKLTDAVGPKEGKSMPLDPNTGAAMSPSPLPLGFVEDVLVPWIAAGARDN